ncbi:MAG: hypothetical protein WA770_21985, partial [Pseudolabrys sp.]
VSIGVCRIAIGFSEHVTLPIPVLADGSSNCLGDGGRCGGNGGHFELAAAGPSMLIWSSSFEQLCRREPNRLCPTNRQAALVRLSALKASQHSTRSEKPPLPGSTFARFRPYHKANGMKW